MLLSEAIDYAGLFPPASLSMTDAVHEYAAVRLADDAWALGRFVVSAARLDELATVLTASATPNGSAWRLSVLAGGAPHEDVARVRVHNAREAARSVVECVEALAATREEALKLSAFVSEGLETYVEVPLAADPESVLGAVHYIGARAKVRTGGVTAEAFPLPADILRFLRGCRYAGVSFKATAGLHHPFRNTSPETGTVMHGFLNVFSAGVLAHSVGMTDDEITYILDDYIPEHFVFTDTELTWFEYTAPLDRIERARKNFITSFGSCSFTEPVNDLKSLNLL